MSYLRYFNRLVVHSRIKISVNTDISVNEFYTDISVNEFYGNIGKILVDVFRKILVIKNFHILII